MNTGTTLGLLAVGLGLVLVAGNSGAVVVDHVVDSNAVNYCQAFTPGPTNTIRNRVVGAENVGTANINVACAFTSFWNGDDNTSNPTSVQIYFSNTSNAAITISCTLLTGWQGAPDSYLVTKSVVLPANATSDDGNNLQWTADDNPDPAASDLGNQLVGINCVMPPHGVLNDTYVDWNMDNGIGT